MNDETTPMRHVAHNKSALADLFGWSSKPKPLGFDPRLIGQGVMGPIGSTVGACLEAIQKGVDTQPDLLIHKGNVDPEASGCIVAGDWWVHMETSSRGRVIRVTPDGRVRFICERGEYIREVDESFFRATFNREELQPAPAQPELPAVGSRWVYGGRLLTVVEHRPIHVEFPVKVLFDSGTIDIFTVEVFANGVMKPAPTETPAQPTVPPQFGEMWRRNSDGKEFICLSKSPTSDGYRLYDPDEGVLYYQLPRLHALCTRVTPKPGLNWLPIAQLSKVPAGTRYLVANAHEFKKAIRGIGSAESVAKEGNYTHFAEIALPGGES